MPKTTTTTEVSSELKLTVVAVGEKKPIITWYRNGKLANIISFVITHKDLGVNGNNHRKMQSTLTINSPNKESSAVFLAKAAYGAVSPMANTSTFVTVWCKYSKTSDISNLNANQNIIEVALLFIVSIIILIS